MVNEPENFEPTPKKQLGQVDEDLVLRFRNQCKTRNFNQTHVIRLMAHWWLGKDIESQKFLYHLPIGEASRHLRDADSGRHVLHQVKEGIAELQKRGLSFGEMAAAETHDRAVRDAAKPKRKSRARAKEA
ncbi:MAG TPA: hypothetical protein HPP87_10145 [Planctomycetes bacterium]|nr:hypothetical protein [Planctomycetota bacterium]